MAKFTVQNLAANRIDFDDSGPPRLDDLAIGGDHIELLRLERMNRNHFWGEVTLRDGRRLRLSFWAPKGRLDVIAEEE
jgi:hypothetical protein